LKASGRRCPRNQRVALVRVRADSLARRDFKAAISATARLRASSTLGLLVRSLEKGTRWMEDWASRLLTDTVILRSRHYAAREYGEEP
jgi:hypothetical protein